MRQRLRTRILNFGFLRILANCELRAIVSPSISTLIPFRGRNAKHAPVFR
jgi:hypothetical protein